MCEETEESDSKSNEAFLVYSNMVVYGMDDFEM